MQADPAMTPQAADPAQAPQTADVSDAEVDQFASAAVEVQKIGNDTAVAEDAKQEKMAAAVQSSGLSAERFNQIAQRSEEHTSELQSLMRISYAVFCLKKKKNYKGDDSTYEIHNSINNSNSIK